MKTARPNYMNGFLRLTSEKPRVRRSKHQRTRSTLRSAKPSNLPSNNNRYRKRKQTEWHGNANLQTITSQAWGDLIVTNPAITEHQCTKLASQIQLNNPNRPNKV